MDDPRVRYGLLPTLLGLGILLVGQVIDGEVVLGIGWLIFALGALILALLAVDPR